MCMKLTMQIIRIDYGDGDARFVLDQHARLDLHRANYLKQQPVDRHVAPLGHIILIPSQPVFAFTSCLMIIVTFFNSNLILLLMQHTCQFDGASA